MSHLLSRIYTCLSPDQVDHRYHFLTQAVGCQAAIGSTQPLSIDHLAEAIQADDRFDGSEADFAYLKDLLDRGHPLYLFELWCSYEAGSCAEHQSSCHQEKAAEIIRL